MGGINEWFELRIGSANAVAAGAVLGWALALSPAGGKAADMPHFTFAMVTHGQPGDTFWDIIRKGAEAAAAKDNVKLIYLANPNAAGEAQLITNVMHSTSTASR